MTLRIEPSEASCGALIYGADLSRPHSHAEIDLIRDAWLKHQVIGIWGQELQMTDLERFAAVLGPDGDDPFIASIAGHPRVLKILDLGSDMLQAARAYKAGTPTGKIVLRRSTGAGRRQLGGSCRPFERQRVRRRQRKQRRRQVRVE